MAHLWWKAGQIKPGEELVERGSRLTYDPKWAIKMVINGFGAVCTAIVMMMFAITKFVDGAWIVLILTPLVVMFFLFIHRHYNNLAKNLTLEGFGTPPAVTRHRVIIPVASVHRGTLHALNYAQSISKDITAVHISIDPDEAQKVRQKWDLWGEGTRLVILDSPYRLLLEPLLEYIEKVDQKRQPGEIITIVVPHFIASERTARFLHANTADWLRKALMLHSGIVIVEVPYQIEKMHSGVESLLR